MSENNANQANQSTNRANIWANLKAIFALPKWAKVFLGVLSAIAGLLIVATLLLNQSVKGEIYSANLVLKSQKSLESSNQIAYNLWIDFPKFKPLLRSKSISRVDITQFLWDKGVDKSAIENIRAGGRNIWLESTQDLGTLGIESLGKVEYTIDFSPLLWNIVRHFAWIVVIVLGGCVFWNSFKIYPFQTATTPITRKDLYFLGFTFALCAGIGVFTFWLGFPGTIGTDGAAAYSFPKNNHHPVLYVYILEFLTFAFGRHIFYFFILNIVPFYLGLFFLIAGFYLRSKNPFTLLLIFPTFIGNFYFSLFVQLPLVVVVSLYLCLYALLLFLILIPFTTKIQKILSKILWIFLFILMFVAILWRHNAIFAVFPTFFVIIYVFLQNFNLDSKRFIKTYAILLFLSAILCVGIVKGVPRLLIKGDEFRPAMHTFLHQMAGACVPANDSSCFVNSWYNNGKSFDDAKQAYYDNKTLADDMLKVFHNYEFKYWLKAITKYPRNFLAHEMRFFHDLWIGNGHLGKNSKDIQKEIDLKLLPYVADAPPNEYKITFTDTQEKIYNFIFENKIILPQIIGVVTGFVLMILCAVLLFYKKICNVLLIFSFSAGFAGFWMAFFTAAFNPSVYAGYYMSPILPLSLMAFVGFVAFILDFSAQKRESKCA